MLLAFSLRSGVVRKNPMAAVRAFLKAFPENSDVRLIFNISDVDIEAAAWEDFRAAVDDDRRFVFVTDFPSDHEMLSLFASIDVALSTHRAEGYGRFQLWRCLVAAQPWPRAGRPISIS